jgi:lipid A 3-O-deacylase
MSCIALFLHAAACVLSAQSQLTQLLDESHASLWAAGVGNGFKAGTSLFSTSPAVTLGLKRLGSLEAHHLATMNLSYGRIISEVQARGKWFQGNFEARGEFFAGSQFSPEGEWLVGIGPHFRYYFMTGTRFVPFIHGGAGILATSIGPPDLSGYFEFHEQLGVGLNWFLKDNMSLSLESRFLHISCAGINQPNRGLNGVSFALGATWFW